MNKASRAMKVPNSCPFMALLCGHAQRSGSVVGEFAAGVSGLATAPSIFLNIPLEVRYENA